RPGSFTVGCQAAPTAGRHPSLRPWQSIHLPGLWSSLPRSRRPPLDGFCRRLLSRRTPGRCDNALCESFFATLECELLDRTSFRSPAEAKPVVFQFIEGWYNPDRRHSALDYLSPTRYEALHIRTP